MKKSDAQTQSKPEQEQNKVDEIRTLAITKFQGVSKLVSNWYDYADYIRRL